MTNALVTDLYELNMAASYLRRGMDAPATFSLFVRSLPPNRGFLVAAGLEDCLAYLEELSFDPADLDYLASIGFAPSTIEAFAQMRFRGEVWAVPEGTVVYANEPILEVTAPIAQAQLVETFLLNQCTFQTALATKAARYRLAAETVELIDFSIRRTQGTEAGMAMARLSAICGFVGTSNVEAARRFGLTASGTMAHAYVEAFDDELEAFTAFASDLPHRAVFLVDTYDSVHGVNRAIEAIRALRLEHDAGVRLDSGDLAALARESRRLLDDAGMPEVRIIVSGGLDELEVARLVRSGAPIDAAGIGTQMGVSADAPYLDAVYKLVEYDQRPVMKLSSGKESLPGPKQLFRSGSGDVLARRDEPPPPGSVPLLRPVMADGRRLGPAPSLESIADRVRSELAALSGGARSLEDPRPVVASISPELAALTEATRRVATAIAHR